MIKSFFESMMDMLYGDWMDKCMFFIALIMIGLAVFLCALPFIIYYDSVEMKIQHCKPTDQTRTYTVTSLVPVGKVMVPTIHQVTDRLYTCDDYNRWR